jgi:hypothetical protein
MAKHSKHQERIIRNYYKNRDAISLQRLSELVTELYLAQGKQRERQWQYVAAALKKLNVKQDRIDHILARDDPKLVAMLVEELIAR